MVKQFKNRTDWQSFCRYIINENRFALSDKWNDFIDVILETAKRREKCIKKDKIFYRARIGAKVGKGSYPLNKFSPLSPGEIEAPPSDQSMGGRINPERIVCLYLSNNKQTAMAEVRSWLHQYITVGRFSLVYNLKVVDMTLEDDLFQVALSEGKREDSDLKEAWIWSEISYNFSRPVSNIESKIAYLPTQYLAEQFKNAGYHGVLYKSLLTKTGYNLALFIPKFACLKERALFRTDSISSKFSIRENWK